VRNAGNICKVSTKKKEGRRKNFPPSSSTRGDYAKRDAGPRTNLKKKTVCKQKKRRRAFKADNERDQKKRKKKKTKMGTEGVFFGGTDMPPELKPAPQTRGSAQK